MDWQPHEQEEFLQGYRAAETGEPFDRHGLFFWMRGFISYCCDRSDVVHGLPQKQMVMQ